MREQYIVVKIKKQALLSYQVFQWSVPDGAYIVLGDRTEFFRWQYATELAAAKNVQYVELQARVTADMDKLFGRTV
jgi:hypothetical protein